MNAADIRRLIREGDPDIKRRMREGDAELRRCLSGELAEVPDASTPAPEPERRKSKAGRRKSRPRGGRRGR